MSRQGIIRRGKVYRQYNIKSCKYAAGKIDPQSLPGNTLKGGILFTVENSGNGIGAKKDRQIHHCGYEDHRCHGIAEGTFNIFTVSCPVKAAHQRLDSLGDPCVDCDHHQRKVCDHPISGHSRISCQSQNDHVEHNNDDPGGHLGNKGRQAAGEDSQDQPWQDPAFFQMELIFLSQQVGGQDPDTDHRGQAGGKGCSENSHFQRKHKHIIQHYIGKASSDHSCHG